MSDERKRLMDWHAKMRIDAIPIGMASAGGLPGGKDIVRENNKPSPYGDDGRDPKGRFLPGNPGGPGNPAAHRAHEYRRAITEAVGVDDLRDIFIRMTALAKGGDIHAATLVLSYAVGKPKQTIELAGDGDMAPRLNVLALLADPGLLQRANELAQAIAGQDDR